MQQIQQKLNQTDTDWEMQIQFTTDLAVEEVWSLVSTSAGFEQWFPEIQMSANEPTTMFYRKPGFEEDLEVHNFVSNQHIQFEWSQATVCFSLVKIAAGGTKLTFYENMPQTFPHPHKDFAGWAVQMVRLSKLCEDEPVPDATVIHDEWLALIDAQMAAKY